MCQPARHPEGSPVKSDSLLPGIQDGDDHGGFLGRPDPAASLLCGLGPLFQTLCGHSAGGQEMKVIEVSMEGQGAWIEKELVITYSSRTDAGG